MFIHLLNDRSAARNPDGGSSATPICKLPTEIKFLTGGRPSQVETARVEDRSGWLGRRTREETHCSWCCELPLRLAVLVWALALLVVGIAYACTT